MKRNNLIIMGLALGLAWNLASAQEPPAEKPVKKPGPTAEQRALRKELTEKYDANKSGRLDKEERAKMTPEDQAKWHSVSPADKERDEEAKAKAEAKKEKAAAKQAEAEAKKAEAEAKKAEAKARKEKKAKE